MAQLHMVSYKLQDLQFFNKLDKPGQINLENNYKDLAISARKQAEVKLAEYQAAGELKEKEYKKLKEQLDEYTKRMEGYHH